MSSYRITYLACDGCNAVWSVAPGLGETLDYQRREAARDGRWLVGLSSGRDYCDTCRVDHERPEVVVRRERRFADKSESQAGK